MSNIIRFREVDSELNVPRIGGKSFLPNDIKWPINPKNEKLVLVFSLPTNFLNSILQFTYPENKVISVFTTYNPEDYFLDSIVYHGNAEELENIKNGFTKVILHSVGSSRNDSDFLVPSKEIIVDDKMIESNDYYGSTFGGSPTFLQNEKLAIDSYQFCVQVYGGDFSEEFQDIFYLNDSIGYLFLDKKEILSNGNTGLFFTQCS